MPEKRACCGPGNARAGSCAGFTILEAAVSLTVLAVALLALWGTLVYCSRSNLAAEQRKRALNAAQGKIEELKSRPFDGLVAEFGPLGSTGDRFAVPSVDEERSAAEGRIVFLVDETRAELFGAPLDLNGDGDAEDPDVSTGYRLLPVQVSVQWQGPLGRQRVDLRSILRDEQ